MFLLALRAFSQVPGSLDNSFNGTGYVITNVSTGDDWGRSVIIQPNGRIVVAGRSYDSQWKFSMVRYLTNGTMDASFGNAGKVVTAVGMEGEAYGMARQSDGKLVLAGDYNNGSNYDFALARYDSTGVLDPSFSSNGLLSTALGSSQDVAHVVAIQPDQKIVVAGYSSNGTYHKIGVVRYNTDGSLDGTFGSGGIVVTTVGSLDDDAYGLLIQPDGKILVAGYTNNGSTNQGVIIRYTATGTLDNTWGTGGIALAPNTGGYDTFFSLAIESSGKILAAGYHSVTTTNRDFAILRYTTTGVLDNTFGTNGVRLTDFSGNNDEVYGLLIQPDGMLVAAGYSNNGTANTFALARYSSTGTIDAAFGNSGKVTTALGNPDAYGISVALQTDGKIVVAGRANGATNIDFAVARYNGTLTTGIQENSLNNSISIYPNPSDDKININIPESIGGRQNILTIYDTHGLLVKKISLNNLTTSVDLSSFSKGLYFINIEMDGKNMTEKFIRE